MSYPELPTPEEHPGLPTICGSIRFMREMAEADLCQTAAWRSVAGREHSSETHPGYDIAGEPATHMGPREECWDPACE